MQEPIRKKAASKTLISEDIIAELVKASVSSPRRRQIFSFHKQDEDNLHRMLNAIQPGSYIRPHNHKTSGKAESIIVLQGAIVYLTFDEKGDITSVDYLKAGTPYFGVDTESDLTHSFFAAEVNTVVFEVKPGPYDPSTDKDFAGWSPEEFTEEAARLLASWEILYKQ